MDHAEWGNMIKTEALNKHKMIDKFKFKQEL